MSITIHDLLARWDSGDGKPYKGSLIDWSAYEEAPGGLGCMCAQGQVLHVLGGWGPRRLRYTEQTEADHTVAKLLNISVAHAILLRNVNDRIDGAPSIVLTEPEKVLGDQAPTILAFWRHLDRMTDEQWAAAWDAAGDAPGDAARAAARDAAMDAACAAARAAAWDAAGDAACAAAGDAVSEIMGARILRERGQPFFFLPMFGFAEPEALPALPADYGLAA